MKKLESWLDAVKEFNVNSEQFRKLFLAAHLFDFMDPVATYYVDSCWHDVGAKMRWTSIMRKEGDDRSTQYLSPKDQGYILEAETAREVLDAVERILVEKEEFRRKCFPPFE